MPFKYVRVHANMKTLNTNQIIQIVDRIVYLVPLLVGFYFVYQGDALDKFIKKRTSFIEYYEPLTQLPTIITYFDAPPRDRGNYIFRKDFNISFEAVGIPILSFHAPSFYGNSNKFLFYMILNINHIYTVYQYLYESIYGFLD